VEFDEFFRLDESRDCGTGATGVVVDAALVGGKPEIGLEADVGGGVFRAVRFCAGHNEKCRCVQTFLHAKCLAPSNSVLRADINPIGIVRKQIRAQ
jgi:hypothetical protein